MLRMPRPKSNEKLAAGIPGFADWHVPTDVPLVCFHGSDVVQFIELPPGMLTSLKDGPLWDAGLATPGCSSMDRTQFWSFHDRYGFGASHLRVALRGVCANVVMMGLKAGEPSFVPFGIQWLLPSVAVVQLRFRVLAPIANPSDLWPIQYLMHLKQHRPWCLNEKVGCCERQDSKSD